MKQIFFFAALFVGAINLSAQFVSRHDSIMEVARMWRDMKNYPVAIDHFNMAGGDEAEYEAAMTYFLMGRTRVALSEGKRIARSESPFAVDAKVLVAMCRERQGFTRAAKYQYKSILKKYNSARAAYYYAVMMFRKGHLAEAEEYVQKAILINRAMPEAHLLLSHVEESQNNRFKAMMPLYYYLLINDHAEAQAEGFTHLINLWRRSAKAMTILRNNRKPDPFNDAMDDQMAQWATSDSIAHFKGKELIDALYVRTDNLFRYLLANSEQNLDFYQVVYSDFFVTLVPRNFVRPFVYYLADAKYHADVLALIAGGDEYLFNEFSAWMSAQ